MFKKILVPLDGSLAAEKALDLAKSVASGHQTELLLLRVVSPQQFQEAKQYLEITRDLLQGNGVNAGLVVVKGYDVVDALLETAVSQQVDLIVMCSTGLNGVGGPKLGTITSAVLEQATTPLLISRLPNDASEDI